MRWLMTMLLPTVAVCGVRANTFLYVSKAAEKEIAVYRLDPSDGKLTAVETVSVDGNPGSLCVDPLKKYLIASLRSTASLASFAIDPATGKIKLLKSVALGKGEDAAFVATDRTGRWLISASYGAGKVVVHHLNDDGTIGRDPADTATTARTAHAAAMSPNNSWVFVPHVTPNAIYRFNLDLSSGKLKPEGKIMAATEKAGPRHLAFHPVHAAAFTSDETSSTITAYRLDAGNSLKPLQTLSTLPADFKGNNSTAEVKVHPSGKFVWVSNRGHDSLAGFAIDGSDKLTSLGQTPTEKTPRSFDIGPDGRYLFAAGEGSGKLAVYRINLESGALTRIHTYHVGKSLTWVLAVKVGK